MNALRIRDFLRVFILVPGCLAAAGAQSAAETQQVLDTVDVFGRATVVGTRFDPPGSYETAARGSDFRACTLTANRGLFCLDGKNVRRWSNPAKAEPATDLFSCNDVPDLDAKSSETCTGLAVDISGNIWLAGKNKGKSHNLVKVVLGPPPAGETGWVSFGNKGYYAKSWATGRPLLVDIMAVDGDVAAGFSLGEGILGLQERKTVVFFPANGGPVIEIQGGKRGWGLAGKEELQGVSLWQPNMTDNSVLVTTSKGRILAKSVSDSSEPAQVAVIPGTGICNADSQTYGIRSSSKSGLVYVTNHNSCELAALDPGNGWAAKYTVPLGFAPDGPTIAPGIGVNLADCSPDCEPVRGLQLSNIAISSQETGLTLFQVKGIPDCRWIPEACRTMLGKDDLIAAGVIVDPDGVDDPAGQYLNVTPLLPAEITSLFDKSGQPPHGLPALLISPQYRAQEDSGYYFEAFFGKTEAGLYFSEPFDGEFFVEELAGRENGCEVTSTSPALTDLLKWDIVTKVSETYKSVDGKYVDQLINTGCGSSKVSSNSWSLVSYNLEPTPDTYDRCDGPSPITAGNDAVFARLLSKLVDDLGEVTSDFACAPGDGQPGSPISAEYCASLKGYLAHGRHELTECLSAANGYSYRGIENNRDCREFVEELGHFSGMLGTLSSNAANDPASRLGELEVRASVIEHLYQTRFLPSVPRYGFHNDATPCGHAYDDHDD